MTFDIHTHSLSHTQGNKKICSICNVEMVRLGYYRNKSGKYRRYKCNGCGRTIIGKHRVTLK